MKGAVDDCLMVFLPIVFRALSSFDDVVPEKERHFTTGRGDSNWFIPWSSYQKKILNDI